MKKMITITPFPTLGPVPQPGFYDHMGTLYVASTPGVYPLSIGPINTMCPVDAPEDAASGGISEETILKAIAIAQRPELATQLVK